MEWDLYHSRALIEATKNLVVSGKNSTVFNMALCRKNLASKPGLLPASTCHPLRGLPPHEVVQAEGLEGYIA